MLRSLPSSVRDIIPLRFKPQAWYSLAFFAMISMELSWISLWFRLFMKPRQEIGYWQVFLVFGGILLAAYFCDELLNRRNAPIGTRRLILAGLILLCLFIALTTFLNPKEWLDISGLVKRSQESFQNVGELIPAEFLVMVMALLMSGRGLFLVGRQLEPSTIQSGFRTGIIMLFFYGLIVQFEDGWPGIAFYLFLFSGMMGMSAARIASQSRLRGGKSIPFDRKWLIGLSLVCLSVVGLSSLVIRWLAIRGLDQLNTLYTWIMSILVWLISPVLYLLAEIIRWLGERMELSLILSNLMDLFQRLRSTFFEFMDMIQRWFNYLASLIHWEIPPLRIPKAWVLWGTILFVLVLILLTLKRYVWNRDASEAEDLSDLDQPDLFSLLSAAIRKTLTRLLRRVEEVLRVRQARRLLAAARIRRIYARLLRLSARLGTSRPAARTPLEFLPNLRALFPELPIELDTITQAYLRVRYGELPETIEEVRGVEQAWAAIASTGREKWRLRMRSMRN